MIQVRELVKQYGNKNVLDHVSFEIGKGEVLGLLGKNGAGKSTIMNIITGNLTATEGTVAVDGYDIAEKPLTAKSKIGYLPELPPVYPEMSVNNYLRFVYDLKRCRLTRDNHIKEVCEQTGISEVRGRLIRNLSKGYRQRLGIAQAMIGNPDVLILDEPTVGLDPQQVVEVRELIGRLKKTHTMLLSSHILTEIQYVCDRIVVLNEGHIAADDTPENLMKYRAGTELKVRAEGKKDRIETVLSGIPGVAKVKCLGMQEAGSYDFLVDAEQGKDIRREISRRLTERSCSLLYLIPLEMTLENVFLQLTDEA